jgi:Flp pilus assembly pilin Flp
MNPMTNRISARVLLRWLRNFAREERGLATIEWVALGGAVIIGAVALGYVLLNSLQPTGNTVGNHLNQCESSAPASSGSTASCF